MDPFERQFNRRKVNIEAILAFVVAVVIAYLIHEFMGIRQNTLFTMLIVAGVGGLWYHIRRVV